MFRRIELIHQKGDGILNVDSKNSGLMGISAVEVGDAWAYDLRGPDRSLPVNCKFYFTEKGWQKVGRKVITACQQVGQHYKVVAIKETDANIVWRDKHTGYEVAVQPKKKR